MSITLIFNESLVAKGFHWRIEKIQNAIYIPIYVFYNIVL